MVEFLRCRRICSDVHWGEHDTIESKLMSCRAELVRALWNRMVRLQDVCAEHLCKELMHNLLVTSGLVGVQRPYVDYSVGDSQIRRDYFEELQDVLHKGFDDLGYSCGFDTLPAASYPYSIYSWEPDDEWTVETFASCFDKAGLRIAHAWSQIEVVPLQMQDAICMHSIRQALSLSDLARLAASATAFGGNARLELAARRKLFWKRGKGSGASKNSRASKNKASTAKVCLSSDTAADDHSPHGFECVRVKPETSATLTLASVSSALASLEQLNGHSSPLYESLGAKLIHAWGDLCYADEVVLCDLELQVVHMLMAIGMQHAIPVRFAAACLDYCARAIADTKGDDSPEIVQALLSAHHFHLQLPHHLGVVDHLNAVAKMRFKHGNESKAIKLLSGVLSNRSCVDESPSSIETASLWWTRRNLSLMMWLSRDEEEAVSISHPALKLSPSHFDTYTLDLLLLLVTAAKQNIRKKARKLLADIKSVATAEQVKDAVDEILQSDGGDEALSNLIDERGWDFRSSLSGRADPFDGTIMDDALRNLAKQRCCETCGSKVGKLVKCSTCRKVWYCGPGCQRMDWA